MKQWLVHMESRKRVVRRSDREMRDFRAAVNSALSIEQGRLAVMKDAHLTEAAIFYTAGVLSTDDQQKRLLRRVAAEHERLARVQWFNPSSEHVTACLWLKDGCKDATVGCIGRDERGASQS